ncbi:hypothetical protein G6L89_009285 [Agrobacterium fabrum]|uniref:hypothetical protein n=1 Tax=Agrobacterium fabrum TaxID=1176649 RepID=UPI001571CCA1|nr:hypothetical protein [Agrobacterium fabrum]NTB08019.1 hypothetical protein [Agrobacterium fabrum]
MGALLKLLLKLLSKSPKRSPKPLANPKAGKQKANDKGNDAKKRDECVGDCKKSKKPEARDTTPYGDRLKGKKFEDAEKILDKELRDEAGWTKAPLSKGDGVRYYDGKGGAVSLNRGYPEGLKGGGGDALHQGPYVKIQPSGNRAPLGQ